MLYVNLREKRVDQHIVSLADDGIRAGTRYSSKQVNTYYTLGVPDPCVTHDPIGCQSPCH